MRSRKQLQHVVAEEEWKDERKREHRASLFDTRSAITCPSENKSSRWPTTTFNPFQQRREVATSNLVKRKSSMDLIGGQIFGKFSHFTELKHEASKTKFFSHSQKGSRDLTWAAVKVFFRLEAGPCLTFTWPSRKITMSLHRIKICRGPWKLQTV